MVEERVYFPGHKLSLNNSEFILNSPVLFTVQAINVFMTGGLPGFPTQTPLLDCSESLPFCHGKLPLSVRAHLCKLVSSFHHQGSEKGLLIRKANPKCFCCHPGSGRREFITYSLMQAAGSWMSSVLELELEAQHKPS